MKNTFLKNFILISFISILVTRLIPHPPNFTSTIALAFYLPALFGVKFIIIALAAFILSDIIIELHQLVFFTWISLLLIGFISKFFKNFYFRFFGVFFSCILFFIISNFGVWLLGDLYKNNFNGLIECYIMALPFLQNSLIGSLVCSLLIEFILCMKIAKDFIKKINSSY